MRGAEVTASDLSMLGELADLCRKKGITSVSCGDVKLELGAAPSDAKPMKLKDPQTCDCGHSIHGHINGLCTVQDCSPEKCVPPEERA